MLWVLSRIRAFRPEDATFTERGVPGPKGTCSPASFLKAFEYQPTPEDVFVVTQMKCGTTFMQFLVYQLLTEAADNLLSARRTLYSVSPWIESRKSVSVESAPLLGVARPSRLIKTHLPRSVCPYSRAAKYIYVVRHPVSCFASWKDFISANLGVFAPSRAEFEAWFTCDDLMWWTTWPSHVAGWWAQTEVSENVLFVRFEDMKTDLSGVVLRVAAFLDLQRPAEERLQQIVKSCGFANMQAHSDCFEMHPPHLLSATDHFFVSGRVDRHLDTPREVGVRILEWCKSVTGEDVWKSLGYEALL